jgi:hypothetical protein
VLGLTGAALLAIPLLFAAVWIREAVSHELKVRDGLTARRDSLEHSVMRLTAQKSRLTGWNHLEDRLARTGLRPASRPEVLWVKVD